MVKRLFVMLAVGIALAACSTAAPATQPAAEEPVMEGRPSEPAPLDAFRADSVEHVAMTGNPQLVEFFAFWCSTCRRARPIVHELEAEYWGEIDFVYLDIDDPANREAMDRYGYRAQPFFVLLDEEGQVINTWFGVQDASTLRTAFDSLLEMSAN